MRKTTFVKPLSFCVNLLCLVTLALTCVPPLAQEAAPEKEASAPALPSDPKAFLLLATKMNGLSGDDVKPWHLKASFTLFDEKGGELNHGTYEEFWDGPNKFKRNFASGSFVQTTYGTDNGILRSGARDFFPEPFSQIRDEIVAPIVIGRVPIERMSSGKEKVSQGKTTLHCIGFQGATALGQSIHFLPPTFCFDTERPALRISLRRGEISQFTRNNIVNFQSRYLPGDLEGLRSGKLALRVHLDTAEILNTIKDADFTSTPDALPVIPKVTISSAVAQNLELQQTEAQYPPIAIMARVQGTVVLQAIIGKDGHLLSLQVTSGPAMLQQAALDAVKKWVYKPYILDGQPVEVNTTINLIFQNGHSHAIP